MPGGDRTGPRGQGPMTGRGAGYCAGYPVPGYMNPAPGGGYGMGRGGGRGFGRGMGFRRGFGAGWAVPAVYPPPAAYPPPVVYPAAPAPGVYPDPNVSAADPGLEIDALKRQADYLEGALEGIRKRMDELESARSADEGTSK